MKVKEDSDDHDLRFAIDGEPVTASVPEALLLGIGLLYLAVASGGRLAIR